MITERDLELYRLGELDDDRVRAFARTEEGRAALAALDADDAAILDRYPPDWFAVRTRARLESRSRAPWLAVAVLAAAAVAVAVAVPSVDPREPSVEVTRSKGAADLRVHRVAEGTAERLAADAAARPGDLLQLSYVAADAAYGMVLSLDGRGVVTVHLPLSGATAVPLDGGGAVALPRAYELDDAPRFERFVLVTGAEPFDVGPVRDAARALAGRPDADEAPLVLPDGLDQASFVVRKVSP